MKFFTIVSLILLWESEWVSCSSQQSRQMECRASGSCSETQDCEDGHENCHFWASQGECDKNPLYMKNHCQFSCGLCEDDNEIECEDFNENCEHWAAMGECSSNQVYMRNHCPSSCGICGSDQPEKASNGYHSNNGNDCVDLHEMCHIWAAEGECLINPNFMTSACRWSCYLCSNADESRQRGESEELIQRRLRLVNMYLGPDQMMKNEDTTTYTQKVDQYIKETVSLPKYDSVRHKCRNKNELCSYWATQDKCSTEPTFMMKNCPLSCFTCGKLGQFKRCNTMGLMDSSSSTTRNQNAAIHQLMSKLFQEIESGIWDDYKPEILSKPTKNTPQDPWVVRFDSFLSSQESDNLIQLANTIGWSDSPMDLNGDVNDLLGTDTDLPRRVSQSSFCKDSCDSNDAYQTLIKRIMDLTYLSNENLEHLEFMKYSKFGDSYSRHSDYQVHDEWKPAGPRMLSMLINLSETTNLGGATGFPQMDWTTVETKTGQALLWCNMMNSEDGNTVMNESHPQTIYETLPIIEGDLYNAHISMHMENWKSAYKDDCV